MLIMMGSMALQGAWVGVDRSFQELSFPERIDAKMLLTNMGVKALHS